MLDEALHEAYSALKEVGVNFVSGLPDGWQRDLHELIEGDNEMQYVPVCNEGVGFALCAGAWLGGKKSALIMENSGLRVATRDRRRPSISRETGRSPSVRSDRYRTGSAPPRNRRRRPR